MNRTYQITRKLIGLDISEDEREILFSEIVSAEINCSNLFEIVCAIRENTEEVIFPIDSIDTCGTGGSGYNTFNTSTLSALLLSAVSEFPVTKHGGKSASGNCGSADVMESLGVNLRPNIALQIEAFQKTRFAFLFSGHHNKTMASIAPLRKKYGKPTIFNLAGPLCNPCLSKNQIIGTNSIDRAQILAETLALFGDRNCVVTTSDSGLDEITFEPFTFFKVTGSSINPGRIFPNYPKIDLVEIEGGSVEFNKKVFLSVLNGCRSFFSEMVIMNSAYTMFFLSDTDYNKAYKLATECLRQKKVLAMFETYKEISNSKQFAD